LQQADGGEGFVGNAYVILWRVGELVEMNKAYQVAEYAPGLFLFGSDGGGEAFAFDTRTDAKPIVSVPFVGMELKLARPVAPNFTAFLYELFK
jgi:SMI1 / KNR4 family (SUKH-1)